MPDRGTAVAPSGMAIGRSLFRWGERSYLAGILNATPDSFSGDGLAEDIPGAVRRAEQIQREGADLLDLGGESTRPGHTPITVEEELRRVLPILRAIRSAVSIPISIDTSKPAVAIAAVEAGAAAVNDVSGLADPALAETVACLGVPLVVMACARRGVESVAQGVKAELRTLVERAVAAGVRRDCLMVDPGFGFGKTPEANLVLLRGLGDLRSLGLPVLVGLSRKRTIAAVLGPGTQRSEAANAALTALAIAGGADLVRAHDVAAMVSAARIADAAVRPARAPAASTP